MTVYQGTSFTPELTATGYALIPRRDQGQRRDLR
jgi:hypothetical protein